MDERQLGELIGTIKAIKENTDKIPALALSVAVHEEKIKKMEPKVEAHETTTQRAMGISAFCGAMAGFITAMVKGFPNT
jgi:hypothetical protein